MATNRQLGIIPELHQLINNIVGFESSILIGQERLGKELSFEFLLPIIVEIHNCCVRLLKLDFEKIPYTVLVQLLNPLNNISSIHSQISKFSPSTHGNPSQARESIAQSLEDSWGQIYIHVYTLLANTEESSVKNEIDVLLSQVKTSIQLSSEATESLRKKQNEVEDAFKSFIDEKTKNFESEGNKKLALVEAALEQVRNAATEAGVSQNSIHFRLEAREHLITSRLWLFTLLIVIICLFVFSMFGNQVLSVTGTEIPTDDSSKLKIIMYMSQKGLIVFCLIFALIWSSRNYGAARHNYVVNKHRNNALGSFQAFSSSASDEQTKNAVLIQATQSIFAPQISGYVKNDGDNTLTSPIIEILRSSGVTKDK